MDILCIGARRVRRLTCYLAVPFLAVALAACGAPTGVGHDKDVCQQTSEFGNFGCAELVIVPGEVPDNAPAMYRWSVKNEEGEDHFEFIVSGEDPIPPEIQRRVLLWRDLPRGVDTTTVLVVAKVLADTARPVPVGEPLPLFAVDSMYHRFRFAEVGERPEDDTLRLGFERVETE